MRRRRDDEGAAEEGYGWIDVILAMAMAAAVAAMAAPLTARGLDVARARDAAAYVSTRIREARQHAQASGRATALVFDEGTDGWSVRQCVDGNGNGVRRTDIQAGRDECTAGPWTIGRLFSGIEVGVEPGLPGPDGDATSSDPVRFGRGAMASCTSGGGCTAGTIFLRSRSGDQYAVRLGGVGARTRVLRFDRGSRRWIG